MKRGKITYLKWVGPAYSGSRPDGASCPALTPPGTCTAAGPSPISATFGMWICAPKETKGACDRCGSQRHDHIGNIQNA